MLVFLLCQQMIVMFRPVVLCLFCSLVEVHSLKYPTITFMGETLPKHAYVNLNLVGGTSSDSVQCHTDLITCCSSGQDKRFQNGSRITDHRGNWFPPGSEMRLPYVYENGMIYEVHGNKRTEVRRRGTPDKPSGIYRCDIPTNAVHHPTDNSLTLRESVYVGLYARGGKKIHVCMHDCFFCKFLYQIFILCI